MHSLLGRISTCVSKMIKLFLSCLLYPSPCKLSCVYFTFRGLQAFIVEMLSSWPSCMAQSSAVAETIFSHILKYIDKQSLDIGLCGQFNACIDDNRLLVFINEIMDSDSGSCRPLHFVNDVDLMSLVDIFGMQQGQISSLSVM